jgi:hypothetical protein
VLSSAHSIPLSFVLNRTSIRTDRGAHVTVTNNPPKSFAWHAGV